MPEATPRSPPRTTRARTAARTRCLTTPRARCRPRPARVGRRCATAVRPVEARPDRGQKGRQHRRGDHDADKRDQDAGVPEAAQERYRQHDQGEEPGPDGHAAEGDGPPGGGNCSRHCLVVGQAAPTLLPPACDHEQRVVDGDPEADQGDQVLDQDADRGDGRHGPDEQERAHDRHHSDEPAGREPGATRRRRTRTIRAPIAPTKVSASTPRPWLCEPLARSS